jgi:hypothetical protein
VPNFPERKPAWNPAAHPVKLRCPDGTHRVMGWVYPDGTIELPCRQFPRPGQETRHLFDPKTGESFSVFVDKHSQH